METIDYLRMHAELLCLLGANDHEEAKRIIADHLAAQAEWPSEEDVERRAREMYEAYRAENPDARMYPWEWQPFKPTLDNWRDKARAALQSVRPPVGVVLPPANCRQRMQAEGKAYPRSSCAVCGKFSPRWRECNAALKAPTWNRRHLSQPAERGEAQEKAEPVAVIGPVWQLLWCDSESIAAIAKKHGLKVGDKLYTAPPVERVRVPYGWKLVPIEPTTAMTIAGGEASHVDDFDSVEAWAVYVAMLSAAPEAKPHG